VILVNEAKSAIRQTIWFDRSIKMPTDTQQMATKTLTRFIGIRFTHDKDVEKVGKGGIQIQCISY